MLDLIMKQDWDGVQFRITVYAIIILIAYTGMIVSCVTDLISGIDAARAIGEKLHSHGLRETVKKIKDYTAVMFPFLFIDIIGSLFEFYFLPFATLLIMIGSMLIEGWSVVENKRRKHSHAALLPTLAKEIIECTREKDAVAIIETIQKTVTTKKEEKP